MFRFFIGADMFRPWGVVQLHCCGFSRMSRKKLMKTFPAISFFDALKPDDKDHNSRDVFSLAEQNRLRLDSLELFLQEYVIDVNYLEGMRNRMPSREIPSNSTQNFTENTIVNNQVEGRDL